MDSSNYGFELHEIELAQSEFQKANAKVNSLISAYSDKANELEKDLQAFFYKNQKVLRKKG